MHDSSTNDLFHNSLDSILENVCELTGYDEDTLKSQWRKREVVEARHAFFILSKELTCSSLKTIGKRLKKDHTTVLHGLKNEHIKSINKIVTSVKVFYYE